MPKPPPPVSRGVLLLHKVVRGIYTPTLYSATSKWHYMRAKFLTSIMLLLCTLVSANTLTFKPITYSNPPVDLQREELHCLAKNIYFEAALEPDSGKLGVAYVTINRVRSTKFPNSICKVVYQGPLGRNHWRLCQFSWYCDGRSDKIRSKRMYEDCRRIAILALFHKEEDITGGATHYHATYVKPWWSRTLKRTVQLGDHIFYR